MDRDRGGRGVHPRLTLTEEEVRRAYSLVEDSSDVPDNFAGLPPELSDPDRSAFAVLPAPFEATVSYGRGASRGPAAMIEASRHMELLDAHTGRSPFALGIATLPPVEAAGAADMVEAVRAATAELLGRGVFPVVLGGEHTVSLGAIRAAAEGGPLGVVQLDAHADLRDVFDGDPLSHACVMRRALETEGVAALLQAGVRSYSHFEREALASPRVLTLPAAGFDTAEAAERLDFLPDRLWLTVDLDVFEPSLMPATGTPEPGGLSWEAAERFLDALFERKRVVGMDVVELAPVDGLHHPQFTAAVLAYRCLARKTEEAAS